MSFWKKWWKKKNRDKKDAEYEDSPLPTETIFADNDLEKRIRARRNNLSVSRSGRYKAKSKERSQLTEDLYNAMAAEADHNSNQTDAVGGGFSRDTKELNKDNVYQKEQHVH